MKKIILFALAVLPVAAVSAQEAAPAASSLPAPTVSNATPATAADVEALREQVQSLTETVKALQQQGNDLEHGCWCIINATDHHRRWQKLHEHFARWIVCTRLFQRPRFGSHRSWRS